MMEIVNNSTYDINESNQRIASILASSEKFEELDYIPSRERLTYSNGFYVNCTAVFIDIRESSKLTETHTHPVIGKIYRSYVSECVALMKNNPNCREIFINGDCVSGIFETMLKVNIDAAFETAFSLNSLIFLLNWRLEQRNYSPIKCGIGISYGRALMMKAGYSGSGINDVIWMGDVVNEASNLCHQGNKGYRKALQASSVIFNNLNEHNRGLLTPVIDESYLLTHYEGDIIHKDMQEWLDSSKQKNKKVDIFGSLASRELLGF